MMDTDADLVTGLDLPPAYFNPNIPLGIHQQPLWSHELKPEHHANYRMSSKYDALKQIWNEWFGLEEFDDGLGGITGRNELHGPKWRYHLNKASKGKYSYHNKLIKGINQFSRLEKCQPELQVTIAQWEIHFSDCGKSAGSLVKFLQKQKLIPKGKAAATAKASTQQ